MASNISATTYGSYLDLELSTSGTISSNLGAMYISGSRGSSGVGYEADRRTLFIGPEGNTASPVTTLHVSASALSASALVTSELNSVAAMTQTVGGHLTFDSAGNINLDADGGDFTFKDGGTTGLKIDLATTAGDAVFEDAGGTEIFRIDGSADSLLMAGTKKIEFNVHYIMIQGLEYCFNLLV